MIEMGLSPATIIIGVVLLGLVALAVNRLRTRGACDCHDNCSGKAAGTCAGCHSMDKMVSDMEKAASHSR